MVIPLSFGKQEMIKTVLFIAFFAQILPRSTNAQCNEYCKQKRINDCCDKFITEPDCRKICRYDTTYNEILKAGLKCMKYLETWMFCAADGRKDNTGCCDPWRPRTQADCNIFCKTSAPKICEYDQLIPLAECAKNVAKIMKCHKQSVMTASPQWVDQQKSLPPPYTCPPTK